MILLARRPWVGLNHLTELLAGSSCPQVRIDAVAPGLVDTPVTEA